jgi:hypothetical protein
MLCLAAMAGMILLPCLPLTPAHAGTGHEELADLAGAVSPIVTVTSRNNFSNDIGYEVSIKNGTEEPLSAESTILVLDRVTDISGRNVLPGMMVSGSDGNTSDGKPFFRLPATQGADIAPYAQSQPIALRLTNPAYSAVFTPIFRVLGRKHQPASDSLNALIQLLIKKGLITEADWNDATKNR